ncbi:MAG: DUF599 family protein [Burkholderiales bacterium]
MSDWTAALATAVLILLYESTLLVGIFAKRGRNATRLHATLREDWFNALAREKGTEILAVQAIRNALMSTTVIASTSALALMATATLTLPSLHGSFSGAAAEAAQSNPSLLLGLMLLLLLFTSLVLTTMAVRYFNHVSFIVAMPVGSAARRRWHASGTSYLRRAGILYAWGLRQLILVAPVLAGLLHPIAGPIAGLLILSIMIALDRVRDVPPLQEITESSTPNAE